MEAVGAKMRRVVALVLAIALLGACTTTSTMSLAPDQVMLTTRGNAFTSPEVVIHDLMLQAAHACQDRGYEWFKADSVRDVTTRGSLYIPAQGSAQASGDAYSWSGSANYTGAQNIPYTKPGAMVVFHFGNGPRPPKSYVAADIIALNPKK